MKRSALLLTGIKVMVPKYGFLGSAILFSTSIVSLIAVAVWCNVSHYDRGYLLAVLEILILVSAIVGLLFACLGKRNSCNGSSNDIEWIIGYALYVSAIAVGVGGVIFIKFFFPELPE